MDFHTKAYPHHKKNHSIFVLSGTILVFYSKTVPGPNFPANYPDTRESHNPVPDSIRNPGLGHPQPKSATKILIVPLPQQTQIVTGNVTKNHPKPTNQGQIKSHQRRNKSKISAEPAASQQRAGTHGNNLHSTARITIFSSGRPVGFFLVGILIVGFFLGFVFLVGFLGEVSARTDELISGASSVLSTPRQCLTCPRKARTLGHNQSVFPDPHPHLSSMFRQLPLVPWISCTLPPCPPGSWLDSSRSGLEWRCWVNIDKAGALPWLWTPLIGVFFFRFPTSMAPSLVQIKHSSPAAPKFSACPIMQQPP